MHVLLDIVVFIQELKIFKASNYSFEFPAISTFTNCALSTKSLRIHALHLTRMTIKYMCKRMEKLILGVKPKKF